MHQPRPGRRSTEDREPSSGYDVAAMQWVNGFVALVGAWIALSPALYGTTPAAAWNNFLVGAGIAVLSVASIGVAWDRPSAATAAATVVASLGLWCAISPVLLPFGDLGLAWSNVGAGGLVALVAGYHAYAIYEAHRQELALLG